MSRIVARAARMPLAHAHLARFALGSALALHCGARRPRVRVEPLKLMLTAVEARALAKAHFARREPKIARLHAAIDHQLVLAKHETLARLQAHFDRVSAVADQPLVNADGDFGGVAADLVFDPAKFRDGLLATIRDEALRTLDEAGQELFDELPEARRPADPFRMPNPEALRFLAERENKLRDVPDEIHEEIKSEIAAGMKEGESLAKISRRVTGTFDDISSQRAQTIASTETSSAYGKARQVGMQRAGITHRRWLTSHLPTVREAHAMAEADPRNARVPIAHPFRVGGEDLMYPGDPAGSPENVINCHCVAIPDTEGDEE